MKRARVMKWWAFGVAMAFSSGACGEKSDGDDGGDCEPGSEACACYPNGTCNADLQCLSNLCVDLDGSGRGGEGGSSNNPTAGRAGNAAAGLGSGGVSGAGGSGEPPEGGPTPVERHGALSVTGADLRDASGALVKLEGISSMWLNWDPVGYGENKEGLRWMRDNWNLRVIRAAMGVDAEGAYLENPTGAKEQVDRIVQNAIDLGVYVIIDWHDHDALSHRAEAEAFFDEMSRKWGSHPNVLYEVFNEPLALDWSSELRPYHQALIRVIRANDPDNVILLGTPNWAQDVDVAATNPLVGTNLMYTLHFYACTHQAMERSKAQVARSLGLPMFVTEWGATAADGGLDGEVCEREARTWHDWLDANNISWTAWKLDGCTDSSCMFKDQNVPASGGWSDAHLNGHAPIVIDEMKNDAGSGGTSGGGGSGGRAGSGGAPQGGRGGTGQGGSAGSTTMEEFPPDPAGCALVTSCPSCCETSGVFALDALSEDATSRYVTAFDVTEARATARFSFAASDEIGAIFFRLRAAEDIGSLGLAVSGSGGSLEIALVSGGGLDGCIYPIVGGSLSSIPSVCWGLGAGPYVGYPADQIEVRVRSTARGSAALSVESIEFGP